MENLPSLLLFVFFFIVLLTRIIKFIIRVFKGIEERSEDTTSSEGNTGGTSTRKRKTKTSSPAPGSRKGPPPGFELDLSEVDDKFGENNKKGKPEVLESDTVEKYKARQEEKDKNDKKKVVSSKSRQKSVVESDEIGNSEQVGHDLNFDNKSLVNGIMMKEILSPPRSLRPYKPVYKDKE